MSQLTTTTINGKRCTGVLRQNRVGGGQTTTASTTLTSTSFSTTFSTASTAISKSTIASTASVDFPLQAPLPEPATSTQETLPSSTSSKSSQNVLPTTTSTPKTTSVVITTQTKVPPIPPSIPSSVVTESPVASSTAPTFEPTTSSSPQTTSRGLVSTSPTSDILAPAITSDVSSGTSTSDVATGSTTTAVETIVTTATTGIEIIESANAGAGLTNSAQNVPGGATSTQTTVAVAGGVIGGLAVVSIIAFLIWLWRKRLMKKRRSTLLTPLTGTAYDRGEKGPYIISRNSLGPTTMPEKVKAVVGYNYHRLRGRVNSLVNRSPKPSIDVNRGNLQLGPPDTPENRALWKDGMASHGSPITKGRFVDWWGRLIEDGNRNWKLRGDPKSGRPDNDTYTSVPNMAANRQRSSQPDFLTLLSMDEKQQQVVASNNQGNSNNRRRSQSLGSDHFLGGLGLNFDPANPFADANAMSHDSAKVMPLAVTGAATSNPFSDANAIPPASLGPARPLNHNHNNNATSGAGPITYVQNIRRSRGNSVRAANIRSSSDNNNAGRMPSMYRESSVSVETSDTRRGKFRSDPFDLDRPELLSQSPSERQTNAKGGLPNMPRPTHARAESFTSKYSSGASMAEWSDPGPDVGPAAGRRWDTPSPDGALGRRPSTGDEKGGKGKASVGKAM